MNPGKLQDRSHAVEEAADDEPVQGCGVVHLGEVRPAVHGDGWESQNSGHSWEQHYHCHLSYMVHIFQILQYSLS